MGYRTSYIDSLWNKESPKIVVKEIPKQNNIITIEWLLEQKACEDAISWFVRNFNAEEEFSKVYKKAKEERDDADWLLQRKYLFKNKNEEGEYVTLDKIKFNTRCYILQNPNTDFWLIKKKVIGDVLNFETVSLFFNTNSRSYRDFEEIMDCNSNCIFYEFTSFDNFIGWYVHQIEMYLTLKKD
jgi:hypothetical protein